MARGAHLEVEDVEGAVAEDRVAVDLVQLLPHDVALAQVAHVRREREELAAGAARDRRKVVVAEEDGELAIADGAVEELEAVVGELGG